MSAGNLLPPRPGVDARETACSGGVYSAGQVRDLAWTRSGIRAAVRQHKCVRDSQANAQSAKSTLSGLRLRIL
jgi:hypothetical protein